MYRSFSIENFRGIQALSLDDLGRINLLTGLNDAGKTSVLEAIFLHASGPLAGTTALQALRPARGQDLALNPASGESGPWDALFHNLDTATPILLKAVTDAGAYQLQIAEGRSTAQALAPSPGRGENKAAVVGSLSLTETLGSSPSKRYEQTFAISAVRGPSPEMQAISVDTRLEPPASGPFMQASIVKGQVGPDLAQGYSDLRKRRGSVDLLEAMRGVDDRIRGLEVLVMEGRPQLHADLGQGVLLPIQLLGDGPVALAKYLISIAQSKRGLVLIDEVGTGLHHTLLPQLWRVLHRAAERLEVQIFATTHSDEMLRAAQEAMAGRPAELRVHRLKRRGTDQDTDVASYGDSKLAAAMEMNAELR